MRIEDLKNLRRDKREYALLLMREQKMRMAQKLFFHLFGNEDQVWRGPSILKGLVEPGQTLFRRELYPKHMEFFEAGKHYLERCFMAANRCITPWTYLQTPSSTALAADTWIGGDGTVLAWDGESQCAAQSDGAVLVGIEPAFRLVMDNGQFVDCTRRHRVLSLSGWVSLGQLIRTASGLRLWHTETDYQASCVTGGYLGDAPLLSLSGIDLASPQGRDGVPGRAPLIWRQEDVVAHIPAHIHAFPGIAPLASPDDLRPLAALFGLFAGASSDRSCLSPSESSREWMRHVQGLTRCGSASQPHADQSSPCASPAPVLIECLDGSCTPTGRRAGLPGRQQSHDDLPPQMSSPEWYRDGSRIAIFYPSDHLPLVGGRRIVAVVPIGLQPIIDAHVPGWNNYIAGGVVHHNTGKTFGGGGFETACHLTGLYPDWWPGKRFSGPTSGWAVGKTDETTRDILQLTLLGEVRYDGPKKHVDGRGVIPGYLLGKPTWKQGIPDFVDTIKVRHVSGGQSVLGFKSYKQGRGSFEGTGQHFCWLDEEPPEDVYGEALIRVTTMKGVVYITFTPLEGLSSVVLKFMPKEWQPDQST